MRKENVILLIISIIVFAIVSCKVIYDTSWEREAERQQEAQAQEEEEEESKQYTKQAKTEVIDKEKNIIIFIDEDNEYHSIKYEEGFSVGQLVTIVFDDNGTEEKFDDKIIKFF